MHFRRRSGSRRPIRFPNRSANRRPKPQQPRAQQAATGDAVGSVASVTQPASVARSGAAAAALKKGDPIRKGDRLTTGVGGALGVTFDDETTFSLSASASLTVDEFVYRPGQRGSATINVVRGTAGFVAAQVAKTGDMKVTTPGAWAFAEPPALSMCRRMRRPT